MSRRTALVVAAAAFSLLAASGCGSESSDPTAAVNGIWKTDFGYYLEFSEDGTFGMGGSPERASSAPLEWGTFTFDGETLRLTTTDDSEYCAGTLASYTVSPSDDGDFIALTEIEDECGTRSTDLERGIRRVP
jgi:hypothetical protein